MRNPLKTKEFNTMSKEEVVNVIRQYIEECYEGSLNKLTSDERFSSNAWTQRQAWETGQLKLCKKILNFLEIKKND